MRFLSPGYHLIDSGCACEGLRSEEIVAPALLLGDLLLQGSDLIDALWVFGQFAQVLAVGEDAGIAFEGAVREDFEARFDHEVIAFQFHVIDQWIPD